MKRLALLGAAVALLLWAGGTTGCGTEENEGGAGSGGTGGIGGAGGTGGAGGSGQITRQLELNGAQETPPVLTGALGDATAVLSGNTLVIAGSFTALSSNLKENRGSSAHVHMGAPGTPGPVVFDLGVISTDQRSGTFGVTETLDAGQRQDFLDGLYYVDVHSEGFPEGEIRGQLSDRAPPEPDVLFGVTLVGAQEVPPVTTAGSGVASISLVGDQLGVVGNFQDLSSTLVPVEGSSAHVHRAPPGEAGPIVFDLVVTDGADGKSGTFVGTQTLTTELRGAFEAGELYVNVDSADHPDGEIRAQLVAPAGP